MIKKIIRNEMRDKINKVESMGGKNSISKFTIFKTLEKILI